MSGQVDAYYKWLGIPPEKQPPNHYQLLGVEDFECDLDVIDAAADQRMTHLRSFQTGEHSKLSQKLLNEISKARVTLLDPEQKSDYDAQLRRSDVAALETSPNASRNEASDTTSNPNDGDQTSWFTAKLAAVAGAIVIVGVVVTLIIIAFSANKEERSQNEVAGEQPPNSTKRIQDGPNDVEDGKATDKTRNDDPNNGGVENAKDSADNDQSQENADNGETIPVPEEVDPFSSIKPFARPSTPDTPTRKHPVPTDEQQKPILATLVETFKLSEERSRTRQLELARQFFTLANKSTDAVEKFALLSGTIVLCQ